MKIWKKIMPACVLAVTLLPVGCAHTDRPLSHLGDRRTPLILDRDDARQQTNRQANAQSLNPEERGFFLWDWLKK